MSSVSLPSERIVHQFEHATVIFTAELSAATGKVMPKLYVQSSDQYGYQREFTVQFRHRPGNSADLFWEYHVYQHPGRREVGEISPYVAKRFVSRFLHLCEEYPTLLFNPQGENAAGYFRPRHKGFVDMCEALHRGSELSAKML